jgi:hypothetical protein
MATTYIQEGLGLDQTYISFLIIFIMPNIQLSNKYQNIKKLTCYYFE